MYRHLLVALDSSDRSVEGIGSAVGLARAVGARITFFDAEPVPDGPLSVAVSPRHTWRVSETLAKAEAAARAYGVPCGSRHGAHGQTAEAIVEAARSSGCDLIYVTSAPHAGVTPAPQLVSALMEARLPLLWASPAESPPAHAISILRDEHRSLAAVLHVWVDALEVARHEGRTADPAPMRSILRYLRVFALASHHAKEEQHLFRRLRERTNAIDAELAELERQHERDRQLVADLQRRVDALAAGGAAAAQELEGAVRRYAAFQWEHLGREEGVVLPAAQRHLTDADWRALDAAFAHDASGGPGADGSEQEVRELFAQIVAGTDGR